MREPVRKKVTSYVWGCGNKDHNHVKYSAAEKCSKKNIKVKIVVPAEEKIGFLREMLEGRTISSIARKKGRSATTITHHICVAVKNLTERTIYSRDFNHYSGTGYRVIINLIVEFSYTVYCDLTRQYEYEKENPAPDLPKLYSKVDFMRHKNTLLYLIDNPVFDINGSYNMRIGESNTVLAQEAFKRYVNDGSKFSAIQ